MDDDSTKTPEQLRRELAELRQSNSDLRQQRAVEQAAERIREEVLAMRKSEDVLKVVAALYQEIANQGIETRGSSIQFVEEGDGLVRMYVAGSEGVQYWEVPIEELWGVFKEKWNKGAVWTEKHQGRFVTNVPFALGTVGFNQAEFNQDYIATVQELTEALSLGYLRFLDFQRLEEQTRQAQVEAALERIRAEVASMEKSRDLFKILGLVEETIKGLGVSCYQFSFNIIDGETGRVQQYWSDGFLRQSNYKEERRQGRSAAVFEHWQAGEIFHRMHPILGRVVDVPFARGTLAMNRKESEPFAEADIALLQRFAQALSLGYTRFLDFQQMEEQNRQVRLEAAVQQVRAEATAMHSSEDLDRIVALVWQALDQVGVDTELCVLTCVDEEQGETTMRMVVANDQATQDYPQMVRDIVPGASLVYPTKCDRISSNHSSRPRPPARAPA